MIAIDPGTTAPTLGVARAASDPRSTTLEPRRLRVALIMPALDEEHSVASTLDAVFASTRLPDEIVVADAGSTDRTRDCVRAFAARGVPLTLVDNPGIFAGAGRNAAVRASRGDVLLFLDFGNRIDPGWIEAMVRPFEADPGVEAAGSPFEPHIEGDFERCVAAVQYLDAMVFARLSPEQQRRAVPAEVRLGGLSMAVRRDVFLRLGGMPAWLRAGEDLLFGRKLLAIDAKVAVVLGTRVHHHMRSTAAALFRQNRVYSRGEARTAYGALRHARLLAVHALWLLGLAAAPVWPVCGLAAAALLLAYIERSGLARMRRAFADRGCGVSLWTAAVVVLSKDAGALAGYAQGLLEWCFVPAWRRRLRAYLAVV